MASRQSSDPQTRRTILGLALAALAGAAAIATIMVAETVIAFVVGYAVALALTAALGIYMLRASRGDTPEHWPPARDDARGPR